ncbi:MAG: energy-coupling factor transporter transmembrane component T [Lachnospiraceae bacterium]
MNTKLFDYVERHNFIYDLSGVTKFLCFIFASCAVMYSYDIRVVSAALLLSLASLKVSGITFSQIKVMVYYVAVFILLNAVLTFLFSPLYGVEIYGTRHELFTVAGRYVMTQEQLLYQATKVLKYCAVLPLGIIFLLATNPSEMAASLSRSGIPYKASFALALTLRYFPDVIRDYNDISLAQQSRGLDLSKKERLSVRIKNTMNICVPLIFSTLDRIELISNTMDLRGFGMKKKRTWYSEKKLCRQDAAALTICLLLFVISVVVTVFINHSRFYNPFL